MSDIVCIYASGLGDWSGTTAGLKNMLSIFKTCGYSIKLVAYSVQSTKFSIKNDYSDDFLKSVTIHVPGYLPRFLKIFSIPFAFFCSFKSAKISKVIFSDASVISIIPAIFLGEIFDKPVVVHYTDQILHGMPEHIYKQFIGRARVVLAISPFLVEKARNYGCKNIAYLPAFVDTNLFKVSLESRTKVRAKLGISDADIVVGYAGSFWYVEGVSNLVKVFKILSKRYPNIKLILMGDMKGKGSEDIGSFVEDLHLRDTVSIISPRPHEEVPEILSACDITCCPKIDCEINRAANPIKVPEYLSMGLLTICSSVGGITYTIENGVDGLLVRPGDLKDLEEKLEWAIQNPEYAKIIGKNGRETALKNYSYESFLQNVSVIMQSL